MAYPVTMIDGIGPGFARKLRRAGITNTHHLLASCGSRKERRTVAEESGLDPKRLLAWVNRADLMRIAGVGGQYADLLQSVGVDSLRELRRRNPENLAAKMKEKNQRRKQPRVTPSRKVVQTWVETARALEPQVTP